MRDEVLENTGLLASRRRAAVDMGSVWEGYGFRGWVCVLRGWRYPGQATQ